MLVNVADLIIVDRCFVLIYLVLRWPVALKNSCVNLVIVTAVWLNSLCNDHLMYYAAPPVGLMLFCVYFPVLRCATSICWWINICKNHYEFARLYLKVHVITGILRWHFSRKEVSRFSQFWYIHIILHIIYATVYSSVQTGSIVHDLLIFRSESFGPRASNKLDDLSTSWLSDWVRDFSPWASSVMEAAKETKFGQR